MASLKEEAERCLFRVKIAHVSCTLCRKRFSINAEVAERMQRHYQQHLSAAADYQNHKEQK